MSNRKLNGRPPLQEGKRSFRVTARFNKEEYKIVQELEKTLGVNKTEIVRSRLLQNGTAVLVNAKEVIRELDLIGTELGRSGNNINQLAHYANVLKLKSVFSESVIVRFNEIFELHLEQRKELDTTLRKIIRILGHG
ncbi:MAG TPA: plasmid mobilization relaxosome protein MobC [Mucilaginibacter sp.]|nr:plasmid mobilization relaxosome protein MobC [Mucilaginibacter sp.]